jgi:hypothetical protein
MSHSGFSLRPVGSDVGVALSVGVCDTALIKAHPQTAWRRSLRIWVSAVAARANNFAMLEATALKRTGAMALACGGQVIKITGGASAGLSSSMMISEPLTGALGRGLTWTRPGPFRSRPRRGGYVSWRGRLIVCGNPRVVGCPGAAGRAETSPRGGNAAHAE